MENSELLERVVTLETEKKALTREIKEIKEQHLTDIKELKEQIQTITTIQTQLGSSNQIILNELKHINTNIENVQKNVAEEMKPLKAFIEELKGQPRKELNKMISTVISTLIGGAIGVFVGKIFK